MEYSRKFIKDIFKLAPDAIADVASSDEVVDAVSSIAEQSRLSQQQENVLSRETMLVLLGLRTMETFAQVVRNKLLIDENTADKVVSSVKQKILSKIPENTLLAQQEYARTKLVEYGDSAYGPTSPLPEVPPEILPETVPGEVAHDSAPANSAAPSSVIAAEKPATMISTPPQPLPLTEQQPAETVTAPAEPEKKAGYPGGIDPYREPIE